MMVAELIDLLSKFPQGDRVLVPGYEDGCGVVQSLNAVRIKEYEPAAWYYGRYNKAGDDGESAVLLVRKRSLDLE
jgi:hypothetical protein